MNSICELLDELLIASEQKDVEKIVLSLVEIAKTDLEGVVKAVVNRIDVGKFDGSKWSTLAFSILGNLDWPANAGNILKALVDYDKDNGAYLNNYGIFMQMRGKIGEAIEYYARAYATDYKAHGHEKASTFPAWTNLHRITSKMNQKI